MQWQSQTCKSLALFDFTFQLCIYLPQRIKCNHQCVLFIIHKAHTPNLSIHPSFQPPLFQQILQFTLLPVVVILQLLPECGNGDYVSQWVNGTKYTAKCLLANLHNADMRTGSSPGAIALQICIHVVKYVLQCATWAFMDFLLGVVKELKI